jgi:hypothetical protein
VTNGLILIRRYLTGCSTNLKASTPLLDQEKNQGGEEEAIDEAEAAAGDTEIPPSAGQRPVNWFLMDGTLSCYMDHLPLQTRKSTSSN